MVSFFFSWHCHFPCYCLSFSFPASLTAVFISMPALAQLLCSFFSANSLFSSLLHAFSSRLQKLADNDSTWVYVRSSHILLILFIVFPCWADPAFIRQISFHSASLIDWWCRHFRHSMSILPWKMMQHLVAPSQHNIYCKKHLCCRFWFVGVGITISIPGFVLFYGFWNPDCDTLLTSWFPSSPSLTIIHIHHRFHIFGSSGSGFQYPSINTPCTNRQVVLLSRLQYPSRRKHNNEYYRFVNPTPYFLYRIFSHLNLYPRILILRIKKHFLQSHPLTCQLFCGHLLWIHCFSNIPHLYILIVPYCFKKFPNSFLTSASSP